MDDLSAVVLARIEGKIDLINAELQRVNARGEDHEARIRLLEARPGGITSAKLLSTAVGFGSIAAALSAVITSLTR